jgi:hypothetical protein
MNAVNRTYLWTVEVDGCLCSCRVVVFSPTAPIIADLFCHVKNRIDVTPLKMCNR